MAALYRLFLLPTLLVYLLVGTAAADPIVVTGGSLTLTGPSELGSVSISGTRGFSLEGPANPSEGGTGAMLHCPCEPGMQLSLDGGFSQLMFDGSRLTVDGQDVVIEGGFSSEVLLFMRTGGSIVMPSFDSGSPIDVTTPFSMEGVLALSPLAPPTPLVGNGLIHVLLERSPFVPAWEIDAIRWDFQESAPVPEPSSLVLLASGGAALVFRHRLRRRRDANAGSAVTA